jgi:hypothetical protein
MIEADASADRRGGACTQRVTADAPENTRFIRKVKSRGRFHDVLDIEIAGLHLGSV